jgi:hypothetical protein
MQAIIFLALLSCEPIMRTFYLSRAILCAFFTTYNALKLRILAVQIGSDLLHTGQVQTLNSY